MNLGIATERTKGIAELEPMVEFRKGVELLKNEYPQKSLVKLRRAFESDQHNSYYISFLGLHVTHTEQIQNP
jgi:hypothetical protein